MLSVITGASFEEYSQANRHEYAFPTNIRGPAPIAAGNEKWTHNTSKNTRKGSSASNRDSTALWKFSTAMATSTQRTPNLPHVHGCGENVELKTQGLEVTAHWEGVHVGGAQRCQSFHRRDR